MSVPTRLPSAFCPLLHTAADACLALSGEHDLVPFSVHAHGEVRRLAVFGLRLARELPTRSDDLLRSRNHIRDLKVQASPCALALASSVNADHAITDRYLADEFILF